jgi:hypothetical protein
MRDILFNSNKQVTQDELLDKLYSKNSFFDKIFEEEFKRRRKHINTIEFKNAPSKSFKIPK